VDEWSSGKSAPRLPARRKLVVNMIQTHGRHAL
jgi:hypothetical protein